MELPNDPGKERKFQCLGIASMHLRVDNGSRMGLVCPAWIALRDDWFPAAAHVVSPNKPVTVPAHGTGAYYEGAGVM